MQDSGFNSLKVAMNKNPLLFRVFIVAVMVLIYIILNIATKGKFLTTENLLFVLSSAANSVFVVLAFCFLITMGIMDLSLGATMILASNVGGILAVHLHLGYAGLIGGSVLVAALLQILNIKLMTLTKLPPWIFGLGVAMIYEAIGTVYNVAQINAGKQAVNLGTLCRGLGAPPGNIIVILMGIVVAYIIFNRTSIGFSLRAVGSNSTVAKLMGINIGKTMLLAGLCAGVFAGFAAAINESYGGRVVPVTGLNSIAVIFIPLAAYLLASAFEKVFNITVGALISAFIITSIFNVLTILGVPSGTWQQFVMGFSVLICGILSQRKFEGVVK